MMSFTVSGMSCGHCASAVTRSIHQLDPHARIEIDLAQGRVDVQSALARAALAAAITEAGYEVKAESVSDR